jgi:dihydroflavonol-4-reductase
MRSCVTGATGFIGARLVRRLHERGDQVVALCREGSDTGLIDDLLDTGAVLRATGSLLDQGSLLRALSGCDRLFHTAGDVSYWRRDRLRQWRVNVTGTRNVLMAARQAGVARAVYTSSVAAVGFPPPDGPPATEDLPWNAAHRGVEYFTTKRRAEELALQACASGLPVVMVNPAYVVGPGDVRLHDGNIIIDVQQGTIPLCPSGGNCWVDVDDVVEGHLLAETRGRSGARYILGGENLTYREVVDRVASLVGVRPPALDLHPVLGAVSAPFYELLGGIRGRYPRMTREMALLFRLRMYFDSTRARQELGFTTRPFQETLERTVAWYREHGFLQARPWWRRRQSPG